MKWSLLSVLFVLANTIQSTALPESATLDLKQRDAPVSVKEPVSEPHDHWKRKGGGGGGSKGGGGGSSSSGGRSSSGSSSSSSGSRTGSTSNVGGATRLGSGPTRSYGGGRYYGGGAAQPYRPGSASPRAGIVAVPLVGVALLAYPGIWLYGAYAYPYGSPYTFRNRTARRNRTISTTSAAPTATNLPRRIAELVGRQDDGEEETKPVTCLCDQTETCGCDQPEDINGFLASIIGDGDYSTLNKTLVNVANINGTSTIILNGTLPMGTTAPGGVDDAAAGLHAGSMAGYAVMAALVGFSVFLV